MSLKYRIAVVIFALEAIMMTVVFYSTVSRSQEISERQVEQNDHVIIDLIVDLSRFALFTYEFDDLQTQVEKISEDPHVVKIIVTEPNNKIVVSNNINDVGSQLTQLDNLPHEYWLSKEINNSSGLLGKVSINFSNVANLEEKKKVLILGIKVAVIGMIFIAAVGFLTGFLLTRRLELLSHAAKKIKEGELNIQTNLKGSDELAILGQTFDGMVISFKDTVDKLKTGEKDLRDARNELESKVIERTSELARANRELERLALHDPLTGLPNRVLLLNKLHKAIEEELMFAVLMIDLDRFKEVNDTLGHDIGDKLLIQVSARIKKILRKSDTVARLGGDEFSILLADVNQDEAISIADKIVDILSKKFFISGHTFNISGSIGISIFPLHGTDSSALLKCADTAMYIAKRNHLGHVLYDANNNRHSGEHLSLHTELRNAIDNNELLLHYQPQVSLKNGQLTGVEALVRWQKDTQIIYPEKFIPYAEKTGLIRDITKWVINAAIQQIAEWQSIDLDIKISINLSFRDLDDDSLVSYIRDVLNTWNTHPEKLVLEITETSVMEDPNRTLEVLHQLNNMGLGVSIDDFGTGYSSMMYLKKLPIKEIKIDRSFVTDLLNNEDSLVIVQSIIDLAHNLAMSVTAEGVEDNNVYEKLRLLNCDVCQGYFIGHPLPKDDFIKMPIVNTIAQNIS